MSQKFDHVYKNPCAINENDISPHDIKATWNNGESPRPDAWWLNKLNGFLVHGECFWNVVHTDWLSIKQGNPILSR